MVNLGWLFVANGLFFFTFQHSFSIVHWLKTKQKKPNILLTQQMMLSVHERMIQKPAINGLGLVLLFQWSDKVGFESSS